MFHDASESESHLPADRPPTESNAHTASSGDPDGGETLPTFGRLLGIDFGTRRLGFALSTPEQNLSTPLETVSRGSLQGDAVRLRDIAAENRIVGVVVGLPLHTGGEEGASARKAREFGQWVRNTLALPVAFWDERCSSAAADDWMAMGDVPKHRRRELRDKLAAHVILQSYLDRPRNNPADAAATND